MDNVKNWPRGTWFQTRLAYVRAIEGARFLDKEIATPLIRGANFGFEEFLLKKQGDGNSPPPKS